MRAALRDDREGGDFGRGLAVQRRALHALMIRELMTRYGRGNIGFLWLILEPMILCAGVIGLRYLIQAHEEHGVSVVGLLLSGYMPLTLWRHLTNRGAHLPSRSKGILYHRDITLIDMFLMTMALEFIGCTVAFVMNYAALIAINAINPIVDYGLVCGGWLAMGVLAFSISALIAVLTEYHEASERFIQPIQYLILPICGFLFMVDWLPTGVQKIAWYMPMVHCFEMVRAGFYGDSVVTHYDIWYPLAFGGVILAIYFPMIEKTRDRIALS
ncbi:MAG TPA: ABC transporter permease [Roseiarcus sp.]|jgi:capsular polysaccharide transport system permease protein